MAPCVGPPSVYVQLLGEEFIQLDPVLRKFHGELPGRVVGQLTIERGPSLLANWVANVLGAPAASPAEAVELTTSALREGERWTRRFSRQTLTTVQWQWRDNLLESAGPVTFGFRLVVSEGGLRFEHRRTWLLGLPIPRRCGPAVAAHEAPTVDGWHADVQVHAPFIGLIVHYHGIMRRP